MGRVKRLKSKSQLKVIVFVALCIIVGLITILSSGSSDEFSGKNSILARTRSASSLVCKDWNDYESLYRDYLRTGPGEQGAAFKLTDPKEVQENQKLYNQTGLSVIVSDKISLTRSVPDFRNQNCLPLQYSAKLPNVSVIIIFHNEVKSILLRTIHSVINRTPPSLLHEIILVNDNSSHASLYEPLQTYVREHFGGKVKIKNLTERKGLIVTRLEGARIATGEVLVFFDSHVEVGYNWLPPLLDPIHRNRRLATVPLIDNFDPRDLNIYKVSEIGNRGSIDWFLIYHLFPRHLPEGVDPLIPFPIPVMLGCAFAIDRKFFLDELGGYDEGFRIWNGENYELSFKLWLCADGLYEVPCSRVTHSFRMINPSRADKEDYVAKNFKRLAEVWMDEYKEVVYKFEAQRFAKIDAGDLSKPKAIRERLNCKPFKYFMEEIAPDILERYPPVKDELPVFASGQIKSIKDKNVCVDTFFNNEFDSIGIYYCSKLDEAGQPPQSQFFMLNFMKNIVYGFLSYCLDSYKLSMPECSYETYGNQIWKYDHRKNMLINEGSGKCLAADLERQKLLLAPCDENNDSQKWEFTYENLTALENYDNIYGYAKYTYGDREINRDKMLPLEYERC